MNIRGFQRFLSLVMGLPAPVTNTTLTTVGAGTITAANMVSRLITRSGPTAAFADTTPTAALLLAGLPAGAISTDLSWVVKIRNTTAYFQTLSGGTGATLSGLTVIPPYSTGEFLVTFTSTTTYTMIGLGASGNASALAEVVTTTNVIAASESGSTFFLDNATGFVSTLPAPALGLKFKFVMKTAVTTTAGHTVIAAASATIIKGQVLTNDVNSGTDADFGTAGELTLTFVINKSVAGDWAEFECDGTSWFVRAGCSVFDAITIS